MNSISEISPITYIDTHCHVNFPQFDEDRELCIRRAVDNGVAMIVVGTTAETSRRAVELAEKNPHIWAIVGLHPIHTVECRTKDGVIEPAEKFDYEYYKSLVIHPKVVGIGECGFDFFRCDPHEKKIQAEAFVAQIALANEVQKPLMLHIRSGKGSDADAYGSALEILKSDSKVAGNAHFFAGTMKHAEQFLNMGYSMSFTGVITFAEEYADLIRMIPLESMMSETDSPYVAPIPYRGTRNEPLYVKEVVKKIAFLRNEPLAHVQKTLLETAVRRYGLKF